MQRLNRLFYFHELSRIRTYIRNLEGFCPDPLDDEPLCRIDWNQTSKKNFIQKRRKKNSKVSSWDMASFPLRISFFFFSIFLSRRYWIWTSGHLLVRQKLYHWANRLFTNIITYFLRFKFILLALLFLMLFSPFFCIIRGWNKKISFSGVEQPGSSSGS